MANMVYSESFIASHGEILSNRVLKRVDAMLDTIELMPGVGSPLLTPSLQRRYGITARKALVDPFLIIYEYDRENDTVYVMNLVFAPSVT